MKKILPLLSLFTLLCFVSSASAEWNSAKDVNTEEGLGAVIFMSFAENMPWIADGTDTGKYLYVIGEAGCSATVQLYKLSRKYTKDMQIRWIFLDGTGEGTYNSMYETRTPEAVKDLLEKELLPDDKDPKKTAKVDQYVLKAMSIFIFRQVITADGNIYFPTLIYGNKEKATIQVGLDPSGLGELIASIPTVPVDKDFVPLALTADQDAVPLKPLPKDYKYVNNTAENTPMYMMPDEKAPRVGSIPPKLDWPIPCVGFTESGFIAMKVLDSGGCVYCYNPEEVKRLLEKK